MRCKELVKKHNERRGIICMTIDGQRVEVDHVEAALNKEFPGTNGGCEEEGDNEGEISICFFIDRNDKKDFMAVYNSAKKTF